LENTGNLKIKRKSLGIPDGKRFLYLFLTVCKESTILKRTKLFEIIVMAADKFAAEG
jgi:hypothetical protein